MAWRLVHPFRLEKYPFVPGRPSPQYIPVVVDATIFGDDSGLVSSWGPGLDQLNAAQYVWLGGHINTTEDPDIRQLWLDNGYEVIEL